MISEIENGAVKTKQALQDASETVAETAKTQGSRLEKLFRFGMKALPLLPERSFEFMLDRMGLARKRAGFVSVALFAGGFAAGSVVTAFATPISGPALRKKVWNLTKSIGDDIEDKVEALVEGAHDVEKKVIGETKDVSKDAKAAAKTTGKDYVEELNTMKQGIDARTAEGPLDHNGKGGFSS